MLTVILKILSILGILLLVLLGVLLSAILLVLFVPVTYRVRADRQEAVPEESSGRNGELPASPLMHIAVKANWLFGVLRVRFMYPDPGTVTVKALCFTLFDSGAEPAEQQTAPSGEKKEKAETEAERPQMAEPPGAEGATREDKAQAREKSHPKRGPEPKPQPQQNTQESPRESPIEKIRYTFQGLCDKIKELWENFTYYKEVLLCEDTRGLTRHALTRLGRILKSIRPRKLRVQLLFGTGSPDTTGYAFGVYGMFCSWLGKQVVLTPDFERAVLAGELEAAGHITVFKLLWHGLMLVTDRRLRELLDKLKRE